MNIVHMIEALNDNYIWLIETQEKHVIIVDPGDAAPVIKYMEKNQLFPTAILLTHHHDDHIAGVPRLTELYPHIQVFGPDEINLPITNVSDGMTITIENIDINVIHVPGHTLGHVAYYAEGFLFCGDTLFSAGCGRIFEGTHEQMFNSLSKLKALPNNTIVYPAHEYTRSNIKFEYNLLPEDDNIAKFHHIIKTMKNTSTLPTNIRKEKEINLFLRCDEKALQEKFNVNNELDLFVFFRTQKDNF